MDDGASGRDTPAPPEDPNVGYWDEWNQTWRFRSDHDQFMKRQAEVVRTVAETAGLSGARILDFGCGTGWLANELVPFGDVVGSDLSPHAIGEGARRFPAVDLRCGDFMDMALPGPFDLVVSSDSLVPMPDRAGCIERLAGLQRRGAVFLLMTPNPFVWSRRSTIRALDPSVPNGRVDQWPTRREVRRMLAPYYAIKELRTIVPGGDQGVLFWVENRFVRGTVGRIVGRARWSRLLERVALGREFVIVARRK